MDDEVRSQLIELQRSVDTIGGEVKDIREEQTRSADSHRLLHQEHTKLVERIDTHERRLEIHINDYMRQAEHNELIHAHMTGATMEVKSELKDFRGEFKEHAHLEEKDRREVIKGQRDTIRWIIGTGIVLMLGILGMALSL